MENYFDDEKAAPGEAAIKAALGKGYASYEAILGAAGDFEREWKFHGRKYGWKLKAHDGDKALFELTLAVAGEKAGEAGSAAARIILSVAAREAEIEELRADPELDPGLAAFLSAGEAKEGWGLRLEISGGEPCNLACALIRAVAALRQGA